MLRNLSDPVPEEKRKPFWLYPNLLSLDAPLVSVAWLYVFVVTWRLYVPWVGYVVLGLGVWAIYAVDRLLDISLHKSGSMNKRLESRHEFHKAHQKWFRLGIIVALLSAAILTILYMPMAIYGHLFFCGLLVAGFFGVSMLSSDDPNDSSLTKNILAGVTFAYGTAMTAHIYRYEYGIFDMLSSQEFLCFATLCILNISAIDLWEHAARFTDKEIKASDEFALTLPLVLLGAASLICAFQQGDVQPITEHPSPPYFSSRPFFYAILTSTALLYVLNRIRGWFTTEQLRVLADVALLLPVVIFAEVTTWG